MTRPATLLDKLDKHFAYCIPTELPLVLEDWSRVEKLERRPSHRQAHRDRWLRLTAHADHKTGA